MKFLTTQFDLFNIYTGGGIPEGNFTVITGLEGCGKTTFLLQLLNSIDFDESKVLFYNTEKKILTNRVENLCNSKTKYIEIIDDFYTYEDLWEDIEKRIAENEKQKSPKKMYILWDSIAQTTFKAEEKGNIGDAEMATRARLLSAIFRKYIGIFKKLNITLIATNQLRFKIGASPFEEPYVMPGGKAPYYASFLYLYLKRRGFYKFAENKNAIIVDFQIKKNNAGWSPVEFPMVLTPRGFDNIQSIFQYCIDYDIITHSGGAYFVIKDTDIKFKRNDFENVFNENRTVIITKIQSIYNELYK